MNETQLAIVISLINNAATQLEEVGTQLSELGEQADEAAQQMTDAMTAAEEAVVERAQAIADAWEETGTQIAASIEEAVPTVDGMLSGLVQSNEEAAAEVTAAWRAQGTAMEEDLAAALATVEEETATAIETMDAKVKSGTNSMHGYFQQLILGAALEQGGSAISGMVASAVNAAAGSPEKITQLTDQIQQQKAAIASNEVALGKWYGTTQQVSAAHEKATADISAEKDKIKELQQELTPLLAQQQISGKAAEEYAAAVEKLNQDWVTFQATIGTTLLPNLTKLAETTDQVVTVVTKWADAHPRLTEGLLVFLGVLGPLLTLLGSIGIAVALITILVGTAAGGWLLLAAGIGIALAIIVADFVTNWDLIKRYTTDLITAVEGAWNGFTTWWDNFWDGIFQKVDDVWNKIENIINSIKSGVSDLTGGVSGAAQSFGSSVTSVIPHFASGGIVNGPTLALVGEAGPEAIIPLSGLQNGGTTAGLGGVGGTVNISINGGVFLNQAGIQQLTDAIMSKLRPQIKMTNYR